MNITEIVKAKWTGMDDTDNDEIDAFIIAISQTTEFSDEVINEMDFDVNELLLGIATQDDDYRDTYLEQFQTTIRENAVNVYQNAMLDLVQQEEDARESHGDYLQDLQRQERIDNEL